MPRGWRMLAKWESTCPAMLPLWFSEALPQRGETRGTSSDRAGGPPPPGIWAEESWALNPQRDPHALSHRCPFKRVSPTSLGGFRRSAVLSALPCGQRGSRLPRPGHVAPRAGVASSVPPGRKLAVLLRFGYPRSPVGRPGLRPDSPVPAARGDHDAAGPGCGRRGHPARGTAALCTSPRGRWPSGKAGSRLCAAGLAGGLGQVGMVMGGVASGLEVCALVSKDMGRRLSLLI